MKKLPPFLGCSGCTRKHSVGGFALLHPIANGQSGWKKAGEEPDDLWVCFACFHGIPAAEDVEGRRPGWAWAFAADGELRIIRASKPAEEARKSNPVTARLLAVCSAADK